MATTHKAVLIETKQIGNAAVRFTGRCCGDPSSDKRHTLQFSAAMTDDQIASKIQAHLARVEQLHAASQRVAAVLAKYQGGTK